MTTAHEPPGGWLRSRLSNAWFQARAARHKLLRAWANVRADASRARRPAPQSESSIKPSDFLTEWPKILGESVSELWASVTQDDAALVAGKVQNLRVACACLHGKKVNTGTIFSFWQALGRPGARKGFVLGRELREGCLLASIGGGLCQMSNALYCAALDGGLEIVERHAHSQIIPGARSELGRDATVYWNYVDLRFRHGEDFVILATLDHANLTVQIRARASSTRNIATALPSSYGAGKSIAITAHASPRDCMTCEQTSCVEKIEPSKASARSAYLLDEVWPEYDQWISAHAKAGDVAMVPLNGAVRQRKNYLWTCLQTPALTCIEHRWLSLYRSLVSRLLPAQGGIRQQKLLSMHAAFAAAYARQIPVDTRHVVLPVTLLADIWRLGVLGGRSYDVLMNRAPLALLQQSLDQAATLHPQSPTLSDFRADANIVNAESAALRGARTVVTPHAAVADYVSAHCGVAVERLNWGCKMQDVASSKVSTPSTSVASANSPNTSNASSSRRKVLFPASALGRKGAYEVREACRQLGLTLQVLGSAQEEAGFWQDVHTSPATPGKLFHDVACVVLPAFVEQRPGILLKALEHGIPVVCSPQCGLPPGMPNVIAVNAGNVGDLVVALQTVLN